MENPNRLQTQEDARENFGLMMLEGHKPDVIRGLMFDMYLRVENNVRSILSEGRQKKVAIFTLQEINRVIDEKSADEHNSEAGKNKC
jgi:hypothetical protein